MSSPTAAVLSSLKFTIHQNNFHYTLVFPTFLHFWEYLWKYYIRSNGSDHSTNDLPSTPQGILDARGSTRLSSDIRFVHSIVRKLQNEDKN